uniref:Major sperm protein n=1 Tax=Caenorhabditis japonica TaxID=281687 RepID=A0A8R1HT68_CAEJA
MFALWTTKQALFLLFGHLSLLFIILVIAFFYKKAVEMWPADNLPIPENSILYKVLMAKPVFLLISFLFLYFPFLKDCMNHPNGVFVVSRQFLYEIFDAGMIPSLFFSFPLVFSIADGAFFLYIKRKKSINQSGGVALSIFILITMTLFVYDSFFSSFQKWRPSPGYCRLIAAMWQFIIAQTFIILYHVSILFQTIVLSRMSANRGGDGTEATPPDDAELSSHVATLLSTQTVETRIESDSSEMVYIWPRPFSVPRMGMNVLNVKSNRTDKWIALRALLSTTGFYKVYPTKFFIPPGKEISMEVECVTRADCPDVNHNLLLEWFYLPNDHLTVDTDVVWRKPYPVPQEKWQYFVLPVYLDDSNYGGDSKSSQ